MNYGSSVRSAVFGVGDYYNSEKFGCGLSCASFQDEGTFEYEWDLERDKMPVDVTVRSRATGVGIDEAQIYWDDSYVGQTKPSNFKMGSAFRNQAKGTFEAAKALGRKPYFHFDGPPKPDVIAKLKEYGKRYNVEPVIDTEPLGK